MCLINLIKFIERDIMPFYRVKWAKKMVFYCLSVLMWIGALFTSCILKVMIKCYGFENSELDRYQCTVNIL